MRVYQGAESSDIHAASGQVEHTDSLRRSGELLAVGTHYNTDLSQFHRGIEEVVSACETDFHLLYISKVEAGTEVGAAPFVSFNERGTPGYAHHFAVFADELCLKSRRLSYLIQLFLFVACDAESGLEGFFFVEAFVCYTKQISHSLVHEYERKVVVPDNHFGIEVFGDTDHIISVDRGFMLAVYPEDCVHQQRQETDSDNIHKQDQRRIHRVIKCKCHYQCSRQSDDNSSTKRICVFHIYSPLAVKFTSPESMHAVRRLPHQTEHKFPSKFIIANFTENVNHKFVNEIQYL